MKNLLRFLVIVFIFISCNPDKTSIKSESVSPGSLEKEVYNVELYFDESSGLVPLKNNPNCKNSLDDKACQIAANELRNSIIEKIRKIDSSIVVDTMHVRVYLDVSVYLDSLNKGQFKKLEAAATANNYVISQTFEIQARRPIMQTDYIQQARRPIMQEQFRYDSLSKTSMMVKEIGGGQPGSSIPTHRVWIVDSGIDSTHQDLNFGQSEAALSSDFSMGNSKNPFEDGYEHGTFLAGAIGGLASSKPIFAEGYGINGVFPLAKMVSIKIFNKSGNTNSGRVTSALSYVFSYAKSGDVVNLSWGLNISSGDCEANQYKKIYEWIDKLASKGVYVVMSAGNEAQESSTNFPGCIDLASQPASTKSKIFTIGSVEVPVSGSYYYSFFSNYGRPSVDYLTPGEDVFTTAPGGKYVLVSGTSVSAAIFSGILYHNSGVGTLAIIKRGAVPGGTNPDYPVAKVGN
ncbi:S8 family peptidase [Algoriphagus aquimarinus]|uniref:Subtilase family protein n=1 Tax=Algoriphagus aquimarinus TaxID=237018 RepID=A0A1I1C939_9BACT|nr:S8/S53 family peptidase [Algoriphagus aquimarinus]SFB56923.1 Subtilase family protein [Algoriphagus aquimarinus]